MSETLNTHTQYTQNMLRKLVQDRFTRKPFHWE